MELTYTEKDGLLFPNLELDEHPEGTIGKYGRMRKRYLEQKHDGTFTVLVLSGTLTQHLQDIDQAARDVIEKAGYGACFGHGFGHSLGLDIHEPPMAGPRGEALMEVNDLCSAEPGIYIPGRFGVRIEDVMIIRPEGAEVITKAPKMELIVLRN